MKKTIIPFIFILTVFSCKKDETITTTPKLENCRVEYLYFADDIMLKNSQSYDIQPSDSSDTSCSYSYTDNKLTRVIGGFIMVPKGSDFSHQSFSKYAYDSICYINNTVYVYKKIKSDGATVDDNINSTIFYLDSQQNLVKINKKDAFHPNGFDLTYTYSPNLVTETDNTGVNRRKFYFENNNLIKAVYEMYDAQGAVSWKLEILFQEYDNNPNPFKNMYFVRGAFFRAFSKNNYKSFTLNEYSKSSDGTLVPIKNSWFSMSFLYNADSYPMFGDYEQ
jgi:hypothetical protein